MLFIWVWRILCSCTSGSRNRCVTVSRSTPGPPSSDHPRQRGIYSFATYFPHWRGWREAPGVDWPSTRDKLYCNLLSPAGGGGLPSARDKFFCNLLSPAGGGGPHQSHPKISHSLLCKSGPRRFFAMIFPEGSMSIFCGTD